MTIALKSGLASLPLILAALLAGCNSSSDSGSNGQSIAVCGHDGVGDLADGNGINDTDQENAAGNCLKIRAIIDSIDEHNKWFTSSPSLAVMDALGYEVQDSDDNSGDSFAGVYEDNSGGDFAQFRQDGEGAQLPGNIDEEPGGKNGQYDRWCKKLSSLKFAGKDNWRRTSADELMELYDYENPNEDSMFDRFGWLSIPYGTEGAEFTVNLYDGDLVDDPLPSASVAASCVSDLDE